MGVAAGTQVGDVANTPLDLDQIQGNIVGFQKDFQTFLFLRFPKQRELAQQWLRGVCGNVATGAEVLAFNDLFKRIKGRRDGHEGTIKATWLNLAFTYKGLEVLGAPDHGDLPLEFRAGMRDRTQVTGDAGESDPANWVFPADRGEIHAILLLAADSQADLNTEAARQIRALTVAGIQLLFKQDGRNRPEQPGHEHFGYRDGISQPERRTWAGEIVIIDPRQGSAPAAASDELSSGQTVVLPDWVKNGSFLVFRRLSQDVQGFREFVREQAQQRGLDADLMGAKLIGRYPSGAPLAALDVEVEGAHRPSLDEPFPTDPGPVHCQLLRRENINAFGYNKLDPHGRLVPLAAHIRKVDPRDQRTANGMEIEARRILRRGIPFGQSYRADVPRDDPQSGAARFPNDRGLLFICYQNSIKDKFEFLQQAWANDPILPAAVPLGNQPPGHDPIIGQPRGEREFDLPGSSGGHIKLLPKWVTTTGGDYFFSPSIDALCLLADLPRKERPTVQTAQKLLETAEQLQGLGSCILLINVAIANLKDAGVDVDRLQHLEWRVVAGEDGPAQEEIWKSDAFTHLTVNRQGVAVGSAQVSVRKLLRALEQALPGQDLNQVLAAVNDPKTSVEAYRFFYLKVLVGDQLVSLPIDMGVGGNP